MPASKGIRRSPTTKLRAIRLTYSFEISCRRFSSFSRRSPPKGNRRNPICFSPNLYRARDRVERSFNGIKQYRRVATRYDRFAANYLAFVQLASVGLWLRLSLPVAAPWPSPSNPAQVLLRCRRDFAGGRRPAQRGLARRNPRPAKTDSKESAWQKPGIFLKDSRVREQFNDGKLTGPRDPRGLHRGSPPSESGGPSNARSIGFFARRDHVAERESVNPC